ncbi:MAG TPA: Holliday junction branch migration protein RuvA [Chitinophagaceae bacterium]|jgi:Holliday junction DNA helicase RuvA|nr:Holliday junction branch migration protein RuvA [Chitinophagaceae bacterium]
MIAYLKGRFTTKTPSYVFIEVNGGVGYEVQISLNTFSKIQDLETGTLLTHLLIKEDAHTLFGFFETSEKEMFLMLLSVSGVGASTARVMLSYMKPEELSRAILQGNARLLESVKGIGRKTAERIILELRDKISKQPVGVNISSIQSNSLGLDALNALVALGINRQAAEGAIQKAMQQNADANVEELIKKALQNL